MPRPPGFWSHWGGALAFGAGLAAVGGELVARWMPVWSSGDDRAHGWAVPALAGLLAWERWRDRPAAEPETLRWARGRGRVGIILGGFAAGWWALRLLLEPFPVWPAPLWAFSVLGLAAMGAGVAVAAGWRSTRHFAWPLCFPLTGLPWPTMIDTEVIGRLRIGLAWCATEAINAMGYPAIAHGTVIEVGRGFVGVDEACGGVRSLQAAIMVAFFLGELFRFTLRRRLALLGSGVGLALVGNLGRTCFLAWLSAVQGPAKVDAWHDPAGYIELGATLGGLALVALRWDRRNVPATGATREVRAPEMGWSKPALRVAGVLVGIVLALETGTALWFLRGSRLAAEQPRWEISLPVRRADFRPGEFTAGMQTMLGCDHHALGRWIGVEGRPCAGYVLEWTRGHEARGKIALHNPGVCMPMSGSRLVADKGTVEAITPGGVRLPFAVTEFADGNGPFFVFYLAWDLRSGRSLVAANDVGRSGWMDYRIGEVRAGRKHREARVAAVAIYGTGEFEMAERAFRGELAGMLK